MQTKLKSPATIPLKQSQSTDQHLAERVTRNLKFFSEYFPGPTQRESSSAVPATSRASNQISSSQNCRMPFASPQRTGIEAIRQFLQSCLPPMDHFLSRFIDAGLRTEEGLLGASRWQPDLIENFLDQLPPDDNGSPILLMDKMVLMHQFATYFQ